MNAIFRFAVKGCLATAVGGAALGQTESLTAQDAGTSSARGGRVQQTATLQGPDSSTPQYQNTQNSEVSKELEKLYRKNGREMPSMNMDDLPNTQGAPPRIVGSRNGPATISSPTNTATVKPGKPNWFERTFHVGRGRRQQQQQQQQQQPVPQVSQPAPSTPAYRPAVQQPALRPVAPVYRAPTVAVAPRTPPASGPQAQQGLREPAPIGAPTTVPAVRPKSPVSDFQPFADDAQSRSDSESLDLEKQKTPAQHPLILPNQNANGPAESPYSGARISPNEAEQKMSSSLDGPSASSEPGARSQTAREETSPFLDDSDEEDKEKESSPAATPSTSAPAKSNALPAAAPKEKSSGLLDQDDDEDEDDDEADDEKPLTLPADDAKGASSEPIRSVPVPSVPAATPRAARETAKPTVPVLSKALRGWCPVVLKDERKLIEARPHIRSEYRGKIYTFSTVEAKELFDDNPFKYAPAGNGIDVVKLAQGDANAEGTLEHAAWYRGRLYLFSSADTRREFVEAPSSFRIDD